MIFRAEDSQMIADRVDEVEKNTRADLVVVVSRSSGSDLDLAFALAAAVTWIAALVLLASPVEFDLLTLTIVAVVFFSGTAVFAHHFELTRLFAKRKRKIKQIEFGARAAFTEKRIFETHTRCGILIYYSRWERQARMVCDTVAARHLEGVDLKVFERKIETSLSASGSGLRAQGLCDALKEFATVLRERLPVTASSHHELNSRHGLKV